MLPPTIQGASSIASRAAPVAAGSSTASADGEISRWRGAVVYSEAIVAVSASRRCRTCSASASAVARAGPV